MYDNIRNTLIALSLALFALPAQAALVTVEIEGTVSLGEEIFDNAFDLFVGDTILATAVIDDSALGAGVNMQSFDGIDTFLSIDVNGTLFTEADDGGATLAFEDGLLIGFDFFTPDFNSLFLQFDDLGNMAGEWNPVVSVVPVPAAVWLFGSGLLGLLGVARRRA